MENQLGHHPHKQTVEFLDSIGDRILGNSSEHASWIIGPVKVTIAKTETATSFNDLFHYINRNAYNRGKEDGEREFKLRLSKKLLEL